MNVFRKYSEYYDLLYRDKKYRAEALYIHKLVQQYCPGAKKVLSLGCGTGNYEFELADLGYNIEAIDISSEMISIAKEKSLPATSRQVRFRVADITTYQSSEKFDVVISLFHVMSYLTKNDDVLAGMQTAFRHLHPDGCFLFDYWYGPRVLLDLPSQRVKTFENAEMKITRTASPSLDLLRNKVDIDFAIEIDDVGENKHYTFDEHHEIRYFFVPELLSFASQSGFSYLNTLNWLSTKDDPGESWYALSILKR